MNETITEEACPESRQSVFYSIVICNLNDKPCFRQEGYACSTYDDWVKENKEELNSV